MFKIFQIILIIILIAFSISAQQIKGESMLAEIWKLPADGLGQFYVSGNENIIIFAAYDGLIKAFDTANGNVLWKLEIGGPLMAGPLIADDKLQILYKKNENEFLINNLSLASGITVSIEKAGFPSPPGKNPENYNGRGSSAAENAGQSAINNLKIDKDTLYKYKAAGKMLWKAKFGAEIKSITESRRGILVASLDNFVYLINEKNGNRIWKKRMSGRLISASLLSDNTFIASVYGESSASILNLKDGKEISELKFPDGEIAIDQFEFAPDIFIIQTDKSVRVYRKKKTG